MVEEDRPTAGKPPPRFVVGRVLPLLLQLALTSQEIPAPPSPPLFSSLRS